MISRVCTFECLIRRGRLIRRLTMWWLCVTSTEVFGCQSEGRVDQPMAGMIAFPCPNDLLSYLVLKIIHLLNLTTPRVLVQLPNNDALNPNTDTPALSLLPSQGRQMIHRQGSHSSKMLNTPQKRTKSSFLSLSLLALILLPITNTLPLSTRSLCLPSTTSRALGWFLFFLLLLSSLRSAPRFPALIRLRFLILILILLCYSRILLLIISILGLIRIPALSFLLSLDFFLTKCG